MKYPLVGELGENGAPATQLCHVVGWGIEPSAQIPQGENNTRMDANVSLRTVQTFVSARLVRKWSRVP
ncbi:hypothetical protein [Actinomyces culturomici]|uniref:hypothetical protein n=1 Tax=Actinomyces culturomici TaxID=1926276 RepID=UPI0013570414|nr:hypothetical protein [Actinomyces culturomici]